MQQGQFLIQNLSHAPQSKEGDRNDELLVTSGNARTGNCVDIEDVIIYVSIRITNCMISFLFSRTSLSK